MMDATITCHNNYPDDHINGEESTSSCRILSARRSLFQEAEEFLIHSHLIFLYADLRLLSATGRLHTKFESLFVESDKAQRICASELSGTTKNTTNDNDDDPTNPSSQEKQFLGISPAQIMAILLIELRKEIQAKKRGRIAQETEKSFLSILSESSTRKKFEDDMALRLQFYNTMIGKDMKKKIDTQDVINGGSPTKHHNHQQKNRNHPPGSTTTTTTTRLFTLRTQKPKTKLGSFLQDYWNEYQSNNHNKKSSNNNNNNNTLIDNNNVENDSGNEIKSSDIPSPSSLGTGPRTKKVTYTMFGNNNANHPQNETSENEKDTKPVIDDSSKNNIHHKSSDDTTTTLAQDTHQSSSENSTPNNYQLSDDNPSSTTKIKENAGSPKRSRMHQILKSTHFSRKGNESSVIKNDGSPLEDKNENTMIPSQSENPISMAIRRGFPYGPDAQEYWLREEAENVGDAFFDLARSGFVQDIDKNMTEEDLLDMIQTAVESREDHSLDFMKGFFKEESMSEAIFKSTANVFWINDWYPLIDLTYAIAVDADEKRLLVVFRGAITSTDWVHVRNSKFAKVPNPIKGSFRGKKKTVSFHSGFYNYLFRQRKDTNTTKFDEIANKVYEYVTMLGDDCEVVSTGFSLGGALATIFAFYASADERFKLTKPHKLYTYGCPHVGGPSFARSFQHQERQNKIMYARVVNSNDLVTRLPVSYKGNYQHVGLKLMLPHFRGCIRKSILGQPYSKLNYVQSYEFPKRYFRALRENFFINMGYPWLIRKRHSLNEHHKRMVYLREKKKKNEEDSLTGSSIEQLYEKIVLNNNN